LTDHYLAALFGDPKKQEKNLNVLIKEKVIIIKKISLFDKSREYCEALQKTDPQYELEGTNNTWILKPARKFF
jgi:hypothetical protein